MGVGKEWTCKNHDKSFEYYCHNCKKYTCPQCPKNVSSPHHWEKIYKVVRRKRVVFPRKSMEIKDKHIPRITKSLLDVSRVKRRFENSNAEKIKMLKEKKESVVSAISAVFDHYILSLQHKVTQNRQKLDNIASRLKQISEELDQLADIMEKQAGTFSSIFTSDFEVLETEREVDTKLEESHILVLHPFTNKWRAALDLNLNELKATLDKVMNSLILPKDPNKMQVSELSGFSLGKEPTTNISAITNGQVWCKSKRSKSIDLMTQEGKKIKSITCDCNYLVAVDDKTLVVTNSAEQKINMITHDNELVLLKSTSPLYPTFIGKSLDGGVLVSMIDQASFVILDYSKRIVQHINVNGTIRKTYQFDEDQKTPLFTYPESVAQNMNTDICVINFSSERTGHLCVMHANGKVHFTYRGQSDSENLFFPSDVCCDSHCNILVSDSVNRSVHLLNATGQFVKYVVTTMDVSPVCMSLHNDTVWLGCEKGQVKVLSLKH